MKSWVIIATTLLGLTAANPISPVPANPLVRREVQETGIYSCHWPSPHNTNDANVLDPGADVCNPAGPNRGVIDYQQLAAGQNFEFWTYGTKCRFFIDRDWASTPYDEPFGHADCPGVKDIKGLKADGVLHDSGDGMDVRSALCFMGPALPPWKNVYCYSRIRMSWEGCLSCGDPVD